MSDINDFVIKDGVLKRYNGSEEIVKIPDGITSIGKGAFSDCKGLTRIEIPNSVSSIGERAFWSCAGLASIEIPSSVTSIGRCAFGYCTGLTSVEIPNSITKIGEEAFRGCKGLTSIEIPSSVTSIGEQAFQGCTGLTSIEIPNTVTSIGRWAFNTCKGLTSVEISSSVTSISDYAFQDCTGLTSIEISNSVTSIGNYAFYNCTSLTSVEIPDSVTSIGVGAFSGCTRLTSVKIPNSITSIGMNTFEKCKGLTSIEIPSSVTSIGAKAFNGCKALKNVKIENPKNINVHSTAFAKTSFNFLEFNANTKKEAVKIEDKTEFTFAKKKNGDYKATLINISTKEKELIFPSEYDGCEVTELAVIGYCQALFSSGMIILDKVVIPKTVKNYVEVTKSIDCRTLVLEEGVKTLYECIMPSLKEVYLPASLKVIEKNALRANTSLEKIHIPKKSKLSFIDANAMPLKEDGTVIDSLLPFCTKDGGNVYIPSEDNPYFMLVCSNNKDKININSEIASPSKALDIGWVNVHEEYALTLREIIDYDKKQKKPIFELYEGNEIKDDGIYDENGELICSYDDKVILDYFYYHHGRFWRQNDLSIVPSPKGFGYRGWNYLSKVKKHGYQEWAYVYKLTTDEDGSYNYDIEKFIGFFNVMSCKETFNMIALVDSECG